MVFWQVDPVELLQRGQDILEQVKGSTQFSLNEMAYTALARIAAAGELVFELIVT